MARVTSDLIDQMERLIRFSVAQVPHEDTDVLLREHGAIIDALVARDRRTAQRLVKQHVIDAEKRVVASLTKAAVHATNEGEWD
jgi:DNA-binding GntR family transcriptional regulator